MALEKRVFPPESGNVDTYDVTPHKYIMLHHTVCVLHLDKQCVAIEEVIVIRYYVGVVEDGKDVDLVLRVFALFLAESIQIDLLPHHQGVVLKYRHV